MFRLLRIFFGLFLLLFFRAVVFTVIVNTSLELLKESGRVSLKASCVIVSIWTLFRVIQRLVKGFRSDLQDVRALRETHKVSVAQNLSQKAARTLPEPEEGPEILDTEPPTPQNVKKLGKDAMSYELDGEEMLEMSGVTYRKQGDKFYRVRYQEAY